MTLAKFVKSPVERKRYTLDYSDWLDTGETISACVFTVSPLTTTSPMQVDAYAIATPATSVVFFVNYGELNKNYTVDVQITTTGGQTKEDTILYSIRSA